MGNEEVGVKAMAITDSLVTRGTEMDSTSVEIDPDALTVCIEHGAFVPCRKKGEHYVSQNPYWVKAVRDYQTSTIEGLTWEPASEYARRKITS